MSGIYNPGFVSIVTERRLLEQRDIRRALGDGEDTERLLRHLIATGCMSRAECMMLWAQGFDSVWIDLRHSLIDRDVLVRLPREFAERHRILLVYQLGERITAVVADPTARAVIAEAERVASAPLSVMVALPVEIDAAIALHYPTLDDVLELESSLQQEGAIPSSHDSEEAIRKAATSEEIIKLVDTFLVLAVKEDASDIHIEPRETYVQVRFRIDGKLRDRFTLSPDIHSRVMARMKLKASMNVVERRKPQDGRLSLDLPSGCIDFRASTVPTLSGEKMVLRSLTRQAGRDIPVLAELDFGADLLQALRRLLAGHNGVLLATGPTGSGKTTTLFAALKEIDGIGLNIVTAEEPIEYVLPRATQVSVNRAIGLGFPELLRSFMRQDPDVILIGEIRDEETVRVATEAALTGHLVLASLHANSALQAVTRLLQLGVQNFLVGPAVLGVVAQRLVQRICPSCRVGYEVSREELSSYFEFEGEPRILFYRGAGCKACGETGYKGRIGIHELLVLDSELRGLIIEGATLTQISDAALRSGFQTLRYDGLKKVLRGLTTIDELERVAAE